jgi:ubiquinone/menaquinone biosynthesis C-methylase UbiE
MKTEEQEVAKTWEDIWKKIKFEKWDEGSENIYQILCKETVGMKTRLLLEAGSGTGRISCKLKEIGKGDVVLLDVSKTAIQIAEKVFEERDQTGFFILGSIFKIPVKDNAFDLVWNAGVLEHFAESERSSALEEMARVCKYNGLIITLNPFSRAVFYRIGKWFAEKTNRWIYGYEKPIKSMKKYVGNCIFITEYSVDFDATIDFLSYIPVLNHFTFILKRIFKKLPTCILNHYGYLLVSIARKVK